MGSPPPTGSKKEVLKFRSVKSMVKPPANTGREKINKNPVINMDQTKSLISCHRVLIFFFIEAKIIVVLNFKEPRIELNPAI
jgi:hypothetical protein